MCKRLLYYRPTSKPEGKRDVRSKLLNGVTRVSKWGEPRKKPRFQVDRTRSFERRHRSRSKLLTLPDPNPNPSTDLNSPGPEDQSFSPQNFAPLTLPGVSPGSAIRTDYEELTSKPITQPGSFFVRRTRSAASGVFVLRKFKRDQVRNS